jgi:hypothetical protein
MALPAFCAAVSAGLAPAGVAAGCATSLPDSHLCTVQGPQVCTRAGSAALTPQHKRFDTLIRQIDQARDALLAWQEHTPHAQAYTQ